MKKINNPMRFGVIIPHIIFSLKKKVENISIPVNYLRVLNIKELKKLTKQINTILFENKDKYNIDEIIFINDDISLKYFIKVKYK